MRIMSRFISLTIVLAVFTFGMVYNADAQSTTPTYDQFCLSCHGSAAFFGPRTVAQIQSAIGTVGAMNSLSSLTAAQLQAISNELSGIPAAPAIRSFIANPAIITSGQSTTLTWVLGGGAPTALSIDNGVGSVLGTTSIVISPTVTTTYTLTASNSVGTVTQNVIVTVTQPDTIPPTVTGFVIPTTATSLTIVITLFTATDNVGVTGYLLTESATTPSPSAIGWSPHAPGTYHFATAGAKTLYAWAKDAAGNVSTSLSASVTITLSGPANNPAMIGVFRAGAWYWDINGNRAWDDCGVDGCIGAGSFGLPTDIPVIGDWNGDGIKEIGVFRQGQWFLDFNGNNAWDGCGVDVCFDSFGLPTDIPITGDWNGTGKTKIGTFRDGQWFLDANGNGIWDGCGVDICIASFGQAGDIPITGDWDLSGKAEVGVFRQGQWFLDLNGNGVWDGCGVDACYASFGLPTDIPVTGDWNGTGIYRIGVFRNGQWFLDLNGNGAWDGCGVDTCVASFGEIQDIPFTK